jgi:hypothetical protein
LSEDSAQQQTQHEENSFVTQRTSACRSADLVMKCATSSSTGFIVACVSLIVGLVHGTNSTDFAVLTVFNEGKNEPGLFAATMNGS